MPAEMGDNSFLIDANNNLSFASTEGKPVYYYYVPPAFSIAPDAKIIIMESIFRVENRKIFMLLHPKLQNKFYFFLP
jgi:hypothetical protein